MTSVQIVLTSVTNTISTLTQKITQYELITNLAAYQDSKLIQAPTVLNFLVTQTLL